MTTMTHEKYNELQTKMDKLADDYVDTIAEYVAPRTISFSH